MSDYTRRRRLARKKDQIKRMEEAKETYKVTLLGRTMLTVKELPVAIRQEADLAEYFDRQEQNLWARQWAWSSGHSRRLSRL